MYDYIQALEKEKDMLTDQLDKLYGQRKARKATEKEFQEIEPDLLARREKVKDELRVARMEFYGA